MGRQHGVSYGDKRFSAARTPRPEFGSGYDGIDWRKDGPRCEQHWPLECPSGCDGKMVMRDDS